MGAAVTSRNRLAVAGRFNRCHPSNGKFQLHSNSPNTFARRWHLGVSMGEADRRGSLATGPAATASLGGLPHRLGPARPTAAAKVSLPVSNQLPPHPRFHSQRSQRAGQGIEHLARQSRNALTGRPTQQLQIVSQRQIREPPVAGPKSIAVNLPVVSKDVRGHPGRRALSFAAEFIDCGRNNRSPRADRPPPARPDENAPRRPAVWRPAGDRFVSRSTVTWPNPDWFEHLSR